jgi:hypothetical protein
LDESSSAVSVERAIISSRHRNSLAWRQHGIGLLLAFVVLIMAAGYVLSSMLSPANVRLAQERQATEILNSSREIVIANAIGASGIPNQPGNLPYPDVLSNTAVPKNYSGVSDAGCFDQSKIDGLPLIQVGVELRCLGRLPWKSLGLTGTSFTENDTTGAAPWYSVSGNLIGTLCLAFLNPDVLSFSHTGYICPAQGIGAPTSLPYPWLTVRDSRGIVLSDRVAVVIIVPGAAINGQVRPPSPNLSGPTHYLDSATVTVTSVTAGCAVPPCTLTFNNADLDNDFIQADISETFNDRLIYITIDELMEKIETRAGQEIRASVERFRQQNGSFPWLAPFADPTQYANYAASTGSRVGLIPYYKAGQPFITDFSWRITNGTIDLSGTVTANVLRNTPLNLTVTNGGCLWSDSKSVNCSGEVLNPEAGVARRLVQIEYPSSWTNRVVATTAATATTHAVRQVTRPNGALSACLTTSLIRCVIVTDYNVAGSVIGHGELRTGTGTLVISKIRLYPELPAWITENRWQEFAVGAIAPGWAGGGSACPCLTGNLDGSVERIDLQFLVMMSGAKLAGQTRPSANPNDYFDSVNNREVSTGQVFDRKNVISSTFNDRLYY